MTVVVIVAAVAAIVGKITMEVVYKVFIIVAVMITLPLIISILNAILAIIMKMPYDFIGDVVYGYLGPVRVIRRCRMLLHRIGQEIRTQWKE